MTNRISRLSLFLAACLAFNVHAVTFKIATLAPDGSAWMLEMRKGAEKIKEQTDGRVEFKFYPGGIMGSDEAVLRKIRVGQLQGGAVTIGEMADVSPDMSIYGLPYLFDTQEQVDYVRSRLDPILIEGLEDKGYVSFGFAGGGFTYLMSDEKLDSIADVQRKKVWLPTGHMVGDAVFDVADISAVQLPLSDVLTGLQTGLIDTVVSSPIGAIALQWHTRIRFVVDEPLNYLAATLVIDKRKFNRLKSEDQQVVRSVMSDVYKTIDFQNRKDNIGAREAMINQGIEFVPLTPESREEWKTVGEKAMHRLEKDNEYSDAVYRQLMQLVAESG